MKFVEFLIIFPSIYQVKFSVASQKFKGSSKNQFHNYETILNSLETFSACLSMNEFQVFEVSSTIQLCSGLSLIAKVRFLDQTVGLFFKSHILIKNCRILLKIQFHNRCKGGNAFYYHAKI